jgi:hypothetical protein
VCVFGNENNATGARSSVVVECENVLLLSFGKNLVYSPRFIYVFQQRKTSFLLCSTRRGLCLHQVCLWLGLVDLALCFVFQARKSLYFGIVITFIRTLYYLK